MYEPGLVSFIKINETLIQRIKKYPTQILLESTVINLFFQFVLEPFIEKIMFLLRV